MPDRIESRIEQRIREAQESGAFDDLPGAGKPLPGRGQPYDENWWLREFVRRETQAASPEAVTAVRAEIEALPAAVDRLASEAAVRDHVDELNSRIVRARRGRDDLDLPTVEVERVVRGWRARRAA
jgi:hypothetical protein